jgi:hypothetical protein
MFISGPSHLSCGRNMSGWLNLNKTKYSSYLIDLDFLNLKTNISYKYFVANTELPSCLFRIKSIDYIPSWEANSRLTIKEIP